MVSEANLVAAVGVMFDIRPDANHHPHPTLPHQGGGLQCEGSELKDENRYPANFASPLDSCSAPLSRALGSGQARLITSLLSGRNLAVPCSRST